MEKVRYLMTKKELVRVHVINENKGVRSQHLTFILPLKLLSPFA